MKLQIQTNSLGRWFGRVAAAALFAVAACWSTTADAQFVVANATDDGNTATVGNLSWAIAQANASVVPVEIQLTVDVLINPGVTIPQLTGTGGLITVNGQGNEVDGNGNRLFVVNGGSTVEFADIEITGGGVTGGAGGTGDGGGGGGLGAGGGIFVKSGATVTVQPNVIISGNGVTGGAGGGGGNGGSGGGGGARNGGDGDPGTGTGGGAGGSFDGSTGGDGGDTPSSNPPVVPDGGPGLAGGGGGGASNTPLSLPGTGGEGGGMGGASGNGGDGGAAYGGGIFVENGASLTIVDSDVVNNNLTGGAFGTTIAPGGNNGVAGMTSGAGVFIEGASTLSLSTATTQTVSGNIGGDGLVIKNGVGTLVLTGTNNYTGGTSLQSGTIRGNTFGVQGDIANNGLVTFEQNIASGTYTGSMTGTGAVNLTGTGRVIFSGTNTYTGGTTIDAGILEGTTTSITGTITNHANLEFNQSFTGTYNGVITSTGGVTVAGTGTVIFTGTNNYTGGTTIAGGTLQGDATSLTGTMTNNGRLIFNQTAATGTFGGLITGTGNVVKSGAETLVLTQTNTYSGGTTVSQGTLQGTTTSLQGNIVNDALVRFNQSTTGTYGGNLSGSGGVNIAGTGIVIFSGTNNYSGGTTVDAGELRGTTSNVQGAIRNNAEVTFNQNFAGEYSGVMSGTGAVNITGTGVVAFSGANTYSGGTTVTGGTLQGNTTSLQGSILNNANVRFNNTTTGTFDGTVSGTGGVNFNGTGTVVFDTDQTYSGNTNVQNGTLRLNASLTNDVIVAAPATLGGNGFINGDVTLAGTMAPGNSIGTMTINGNYSTTAGSVQQIEIIPGGNTPGVHNDQIVVNGNVTLSGGTVSVVSPTSTGFGGGTKYTFLQHTGTRGGVFDGITTNSAFLNATLVYDPNSVAFLIARNATTFRDVALTFNQRQVATYLDEQNLLATGDFVGVLDQIQTLDAGQARNAFDQLVGSIYGSAAQANFQNVTLMYNMLRRNLRNDDELGSPAYADDFAAADSLDSDIMLVDYSPDDRAFIVPVQTTGMRRRRVWNAWTTSYGSGNESDDRIGLYGAGGTMLSIYRNLDEAWKFGAFGAYNYVSLRSQEPAIQRIQQNSGQFGTYLRGDDGTNYLMWATALGFDNYESTRQIQFGNINATARGDHGGYQYSSYLEFGRQFNIWPIDLEPFGALQHSYSRQNPFTENGAPGMNLQVGGVDANSLRTILGGRALWDVLNWAGKPVRPEMHVAWIHELLDETTAFNSVFAGVGGTSFATEGVDFGKNWGLFGGGLNFAFTDRILLAAHYDMQANSRSRVHLGSATMQVRW